MINNVKIHVLITKKIYYACKCLIIARMPEYKACIHVYKHESFRYKNIICQTFAIFLYPLGKLTYVFTHISTIAHKHLFLLNIHVIKGSVQHLIDIKSMITVQEQRYTL